MSDRYNGWANYETWRINLEMFDGFDPSDYLDRHDLSDEDGKEKATDYLTDVLRSLVAFDIEMDCPNREGFVYDLAMSFLSKVDYREIAAHMVDDVAAELV
jgi:hypothetical protein